MIRSFGAFFVGIEIAGKIDMKEKHRFDVSINWGQIKRDRLVYVISRLNILHITSIGLRIVSRKSVRKNRR